MAVNLDGMYICRKSYIVFLIAFNTEVVKSLSEKFSKQKVDYKHPESLKLDHVGRGAIAVVRLL